MRRLMTARLTKMKSIRNMASVALAMSSIGRATAMKMIKAPLRNTARWGVRFL